MAGLMEMSLEDIIKKKKRKNLRNPKQAVRNNDAPIRPGSITKKLPVTDARNKIIMKKRIQITDAREKLAEIARQKDARLKLEQLRRNKNIAQNKGRKFKMNRDKFVRAVAANREMIFVDRSRQVVSQPLLQSKMQARISSKTQLNHRRNQNASYERRPKPIVRTIENDIIIEDDPMDEDYVRPKSAPLVRKANLQLKIIAHNNDNIAGRNAVMVQRSTQRPAYEEKETSPPRPPSILKKRPMAALRSEKKPDITDAPSLEHRIIVSNLRNTVTGGDIEELFGDIGGMVESRLVRPGTAEVIYKTVEDAQRAVDLYHNRQLDGQPMNCLLVTPRPNAIPSRSCNTPLYSTNSNVEPDLSTFHKVLFSNL